MIIRKARVDKKKRRIEVETRKGIFGLPFGRLQVIPTAKNPIEKIYVDQELAKQAVTYVLDSGDEGTVHLDAFLDYNHEPDFIRDLTLTNLTLQCQKIVDRTRLDEKELARKLAVPEAQLNRLLDSTNHKKTIDHMIKLLAGLNHWVEFTVTPCNSGKSAA